jgi:hypothetical protein
MMKKDKEQKKTIVKNEDIERTDPVSQTYSYAEPPLALQTSLPDSDCFRALNVPLCRIIKDPMTLSSTHTSSKLYLLVVDCALIPQSLSI